MNHLITFFSCFLLLLNTTQGQSTPSNLNSENKLKEEMNTFFCFIKDNFNTSVLENCKSCYNLNFVVSIDSNAEANSQIYGNTSEDITPIKKEWERVISQLPSMSPTTIELRPMKTDQGWELFPEFFCVR